jgi:cellulose synthase/poly-beta-1,6-N-acetylglucosamine synthase-like glycosyltransferase
VSIAVADGGAAIEAAPVTAHRSLTVSVVIPALNEAVNLSRGLPVIRAQLLPRDELIVADNGSADDTALVASSLGACVVREPVRGRSHARNAGMRQARGEIVVFVDADCLPTPGWLASMMAPFADPTVGAVAGEIDTLEMETPLGQYLASKGHLSQAANFQHGFLPAAGSGNVAYRRTVLNQIGGFDETLYAGHDADLSWRMQIETGFRLMVAPRAIVRHRQEMSLRALFRQKRRHAHGGVLLYEKYRAQWNRPPKPLKHLYWEYRSMLRRSAALGVRSAGALVGLAERPPQAQGYQLLMELGASLGRLEYSIRRRVWFP